MSTRDRDRYRPSPRVENLRGLPCSITNDDKLWCVSGLQHTETGSGGGILEWCYEEQDAKEEYQRLSKDQTGLYENLSYHKYL